MSTTEERNDRVSQLEYEYARLQEGYGSMSREHSQTIVELSDALYSCDQLQAENAKLRELVVKMRYIAAWTSSARKYIDNAMRELGIEVDA